VSGVLGVVGGEKNTGKVYALRGRSENDIL
jgi:hypothetical protein